jgi:hypothetical protein
MRRNGDGTYAVDSPVHRLLEFLPFGDECWEWQGNRRANGYGSFWMDGSSRLAHRAVYELLVGPIPDGLQIDHLCRNRACVNPSHLEVVDARTNVLRSMNLAALNARKTHCKHGHPFDEANTAVLANGSRRCRTCGRAKTAAYRARLKGDSHE